MGSCRQGLEEHRELDSHPCSMRPLLATVFALCILPILAWSPAYGDPLAEEQERDLRSSLLGAWATGARGDTKLILLEDGSLVFNGSKAHYRVQAGSLVIQWEGGEASYAVKLEGKKLTLSGDTLSGPLILFRRSLASDWLSLFTAESAVSKLLRIFQILLIVVAARLVIWFLRWLSSVLIYSNRGPLRYLYPRNKNRARTIHSLGLNVLKYVVYLLAAGFVLSELGINYTAYFVSLSFVGLAIGFGAQGLVQDMVTGFFILFEGQFEVGDMVEISGQVGVIKEFGLRMTSLRNYLGQTVFTPNRNILTVGKFLKGAQQVWVDVQVADQAAADQGAKLLRQVGEAVSRQFEGVMLITPEVSGPRALATGEQFLRLATSIWPKQEWVVEQQMIPRIRESFKRAGLEIPEDRVVVFYHIREEVTVSAPRFIFKAPGPRREA